MKVQASWKLVIDGWIMHSKCALFCFFGDMNGNLERIPLSQIWNRIERMKRNILLSDWGSIGIVQHRISDLSTVPSYLLCLRTLFLFKKLRKCGSFLEKSYEPTYGRWWILALLLSIWSKKRKLLILHSQQIQTFQTQLLF